MKPRTAIRRSTFKATRWLLPMACALMIVGAASTAQACPSCQAALAGDESQGDLARGIYYSILFMMSMPFAIVGTFTGLAYRAFKRDARRKAAEAAEKNQSASAS